MPIAVAKLVGKTKMVATKILGSPQGAAPFYRIAEVYFPSMQALEACAASEGGKEALAHAVKISAGGERRFSWWPKKMTFTFTKTVKRLRRKTGCVSRFSIIVPAAVCNRE